MWVCCCYWWLDNCNQSIQIILQLLVILYKWTFFLHHTKRPWHYLSNIPASFITAPDQNSETVMMLGLTSVSHWSLFKLCANLIAKYTDVKNWQHSLFIAILWYSVWSLLSLFNSVHSHCSRQLALLSLPTQHYAAGWEPQTMSLFTFNINIRPGWQLGS